jgi:uncharacterized protein (TIGR02391 family)
MGKRRKTVIDELRQFREDLINYIRLRKKQIVRREKLIKSEMDDLNSLFNEIGIHAGKFERLIKEITGAEFILVDTVPQDLWNWALSTRDNNVVINALDNCLSATSRTIGIIEKEIDNGIRDEQGNLIKQKQTEDITKKSLESLIQIFDAMKFHEKITLASRALFVDKHYAQAIFEAFKAVENYVQDKANSHAFGTNLMETVFDEENPIIKVPEAGHYYKDVQRGFKHLFIGATQAIRNPKAHKEIVQKDPYITLEYLGFASFLLKRISYWEAGTT